MGRYAFLRGRVVPMQEATISVMTHAFLYGTACFEGIRGYWVPEEEQIYLFRLRDHYERLLQSCRILRIQPQYTVDQLCELTVDLVRRNGDREDIYVRPVYYKASEQIGVKLTGIDDDFLVFAVPMGPYVPLHTGLRVRVTSWRHIEDNAIPMRAKVNGAYVNAALAKSEALDDGYDEAIFLDSGGHVSEGSAENIFLVRKGTLITPPVTDEILEGITRDTIIRIAAELRIPVVERTIDRSELYVADEVFLVGTGAQVSPVVEIDRRPIGTGKPGPVVRTIQDRYFDVVKGKIAAYREWCTPIYP
ncbi:MAG TPA: branched-chain amino acid transaminase [Limnochordia bacterium]